MRLVEDLGMLFATEKSTKKRRFGLYECPICLTIFKCQSTSVLQGNTTKCKSCADKITAANKALKVSESFSQECDIIHLGKYDYSLVEYINNKTHIQIICPTHGVFLQTPSMHKHGQGCPKCSSTLSSSKDFIKECSIVHKGIYDYSLVEYINDRTRVKIICPTHGVFLQIPGNHKQGRGCPKCAKYGFNQSKPATMYYLKIGISSSAVYKIGITNRSVVERFARKDLAKIVVIKVWYFSLGADAYSKEQEIITEYKEFSYVGEPILTSGNTELFIKDILELDKEGST